MPYNQDLIPDFDLCIPGLGKDHNGRLLNISNFNYFCQTVTDILAEKCPFCVIDPETNHMVDDISSEFWVVIHNTVAPKSNQDYQFVIPCRRHVQNIEELTSEETRDFFARIVVIKEKFGIDGGVVAMRSGNPIRHAGSVPHLHGNFHVPSGTGEVIIVIGKGPEQWAKKIPILKVFALMYRLKMNGVEDPFSLLEPEKQVLVKDHLGPPILAKAPIVSTKT